MADINKKTTIIGVEEEAVAGTYDPPSAATSFVQPLEDGFEQTHSKELIDRTILTPSIGQVTPRVGIKSATASLPVEMRGSGTEAGAPDFDPLLRSALGSVRSQGSRTTSGTGHTTTVIDLDAGTIGNFNVGDGIVILEAGDHTVHIVTAKDTGVGTEAITISPARAVAPSDNVEITGYTSYIVANDSHPSLSLSYYYGNSSDAVNQRGIGMKVTSLSLDNFTTGQVASWNFGLEGLSFAEVLEVAPFTPSFDTGLPPLILNACIYQDGVQIDVNSFTLSLTNTLAFKTSTCDANGRISSIVSERSITGTIDPFKDSTSISQFTLFDQNTPYSLIATAYNPSTTSGEIDLGSVVTIYLPNCITTEKPLGDLDDLVTDNITFSATAGDSGSSDDIYISVI